MFEIYKNFITSFQFSRKNNYADIAKGENAHLDSWLFYTHDFSKIRFLALGLVMWQPHLKTSFLKNVKVEAVILLFINRLFVILAVETVQGWRTETAGKFKYQLKK